MDLIEDLIEEEAMNLQSIIATVVVAALFAVFIGVKANFLWNGSQE